MVVRTTLPRRTTCKSSRFINRSAVQRATGNGQTFAIHLLQNLVGAVDTFAGLPDALDLWPEGVVCLGACAAQIRVALAHGVTAVARRGYLQDFADRLGPVGIAILIDEVLQYLSFRSSSARAENALASLKISLAWRSSLTSRFNAFTRSCSDVVVLALMQVSTLSRLTHSLSVCGTQPIFGAID